MVSDSASETRSTWFDAASPYRVPVRFGADSRCGLWTGVARFAPGRCGSVGEWIVAADAHQLFEPDTSACRFHPDGSIASAPIAVALPARVPPPRAPVHLYYGGPRREPVSRLLELRPPRHLAIAASYEIGVDADARVRRLALRSVRHDLLGPRGEAGPAAIVGTDVAAAGPGNARLELRPRGPGRIEMTIDRTVGGTRCLAVWQLLPSEIRINVRFEIGDQSGPIDVWRIRHPANAGYAVTPDDRMIDLSDPDAARHTFTGALPFPGYALSAQGGYAVIVEPTADSPTLDRFEIAPGDDEDVVVALGFSSPEPGAVIETTVRWIPMPYAGPVDLTQARAARQAAAGPGPISFGAEELRPARWAPRVETGNDRIAVRCGDLRAEAVRIDDRWRLRFDDGDTRLMETDPLWEIADDADRVEEVPVRHASMLTGAMHLRGRSDPGDGGWEIRSILAPRVVDGVVLFEETRDIRADDDRDARFTVRARTGIGPPDWDGPRTVFVPGSFARWNYAPGQPHGGGPKWGPHSDLAGPEHCKHEQGGAADHWTFAASRLPLVWACAADRDLRRLACIGTEPACDSGETCAGFAAPADGETILSLHTPTLYEPRVPTGYGGFSDEPLRTTAAIPRDRVVRWRVFFGGAATDDLNGWNGFQRAIYRISAGHRPASYKMTLDHALRLVAGALHDRFYDPDRRILTYGTGPEAKWAPIGFTGMAHGAAVLAEAGARCGRDDWRNAGLAVLDHVATAFVDGPGFPFASWDGEKWGFGSSEPGYVILCALDSLQTAAAWERGRGADHPDWHEAIDRCCHAWVDAQHPDGRYPHRHPAMGSDDADYATSNVEAGVAGCLARHARWTGDTQFLDSAVRAGERYARDLANGQLFGGPGDIEALVNSEVPMWFLRAFAELHRTEPDGRWLPSACAAAAWRLSFQFGHQWPVNFGSPLYRQGWAGLGCESASASNVHAVCYGALNLRDYRTLYLATGDPLYLDRGRDLVGYLDQQFGRFPGDAGTLDTGLGTESFWVSESRWGKGHVLILPQLGFMSWVTGWAGLGILLASEWPEAVGETEAGA